MTRVLRTLVAVTALGGGPILVEALTLQARLESEPVSKDAAERQRQLTTALAARRGRDAHTLHRQKGDMNGAR